MLNIIIILFIIFLVLLYFYISYRVEKDYVEIDNEVETKKVKDYVWFANKKPQKGALDYYRLGCVYDYIYKNPVQARKYYEKAAENIDANRPRKHDGFIFDKLMNRLEIDVYMEEPIVEIKLPKKKPKSKIEWTSDMQNVHDKNVTDDSAKFFREINDKTIDRYNFNECVELLKSVKLPRNEEKNRAKAINVLKHIEKYNPRIYNMQCSEKDFICAVVTDISTNYDQQKTNTLYENLMMNLADCDSADSIVCINGRVTRILNSYNDGENMNFRTTQVIKNEMLDLAAKTQNSFIEQLSEEDKKLYENDNPEIISRLKTEVMNKISEVDGAEKMKDIKKEILDAL